MDDEAADIELLEQHLNKTKLISQRMTGILSKFDTRLVKLEKTILPLHKSALSLTKISDNIDRTLKSIQQVVTNQENATSEEALIMRGPQATKLSVYTDALERLNANFAFAPDRMTPDATRLVETGAKKLTQLYTKLVAEGSSGSPPESSPLISPRPVIHALSPTLTPLVAALRALPVPATHPSHPASPAIWNTLKEAQKGYAEMRGQWCRRCIDAQSHRVMDRIETMEAIEGGREFGRWVDNFLNYIEGEYALLQTMTPIPSLNNQSFEDFIQPLISLFQSDMATFTNLIKRSLPKYTFLALSAYSSLMALQNRWADLITKPTARRENELKEGLHSLRAICLRSFPEFLADIKMASIKPAEAQFLGTGVAELTVKSVNFLEQVPLVEEAVIASLSTLGDGNWRMGEGVGKGGKIGNNTAVESEKALVEHFIHDVIMTLVNTLNTLAKGRRPQMGSIYFLNNVSFIRSRLLDNPETSIDSLIAAETRNFINSNFRVAKATYFDSNFSPLIQSLGDDKERSGGLVGSGRSAQMKEKWSRFFGAFEELAERHRVARVMPDEPEGRVMLQDEAVRLVLPLLLRFTEKHKDKEFSKNPQKYIKATPTEVEQQIKDFYR